MPLLTTLNTFLAFVVYRERDNSPLVYSLWIGGTVRVSDSPSGKFTRIENFSYPGGMYACVCCVVCMYACMYACIHVHTGVLLFGAIEIVTPYLCDRARNTLRTTHDTHRQPSAYLPPGCFLLNQSGAHNTFLPHAHTHNCGKLADRIHKHTCA